MAPGGRQGFLDSVVDGTEGGALNRCAGTIRRGFLGVGVRDGGIGGERDRRERIQECTRRSHRSVTVPRKLLYSAVGHRTKAPGICEGRIGL
jgi:hypothetical protein